MLFSCSHLLQFERLAGNANQHLELAEQPALVLLANELANRPLICLT